MAANPVDEAVRRISDSRVELEAMLGSGPPAADDEFPRSRVFRAIFNRKVATGVLALAAVAVVLRPAAAGRALNRLPLRLLATRLLLR